VARVTDAPVPGSQPPPTATPAGEVEITEQLVRRLVNSQFPEYAGLSLARLNEGWDNTVYRLGGDLLVRLPRRQLAAEIAVVEHEWLPRLASDWSFPAPVPVAVGAPDDSYPWNWALVPWLEGEVAMRAPLDSEGAADLGVALAQVHVPAPDAAPYNAWRSTPLAERTARLGQRIALASANERWALDGERAAAAVAAADERGALSWCHLDIHGNNVLTRGGRLAGLLDWGDSGAGDPATDLGQALAMLGSTRFESLADAYRDAGGPGDPSSPRVRAEAVVSALTLAVLEEPDYRAAGWAALEDLGLAQPA